MIDSGKVGTYLSSDGGSDSGRRCVPYSKMNPTLFVTFSLKQWQRLRRGGGALKFTGVDTAIFPLYVSNSTISHYLGVYASSFLNHQAPLIIKEPQGQQVQRKDVHAAR